MYVDISGVHKYEYEYIKISELFLRLGAVPTTFYLNPLKQRNREDKKT